MSLLEKYQRVNNTFTYSISSAGGIDRNDGSGDEIGEFQIEIPPVPFPTNQQSKLGIFTLESFYITGQTNDAYVSAGVGGLPANTGAGRFDISGFYIEVNGLGVRGNNFVNARANKLRSNKTYTIMNEYGTQRKESADAEDYARVLSGGKSGVETICSNPSGTTLTIRVLSLDTIEPITAQAGLDSIINFKIELLPDDFQEREMN